MASPVLSDKNYNMIMKFICLRSLFMFVLLLLGGCQGELYNNAELFKENFGQATTPTGCQTDIKTGFSQGDGSTSSPYEICNKDQLINLAIKLNNLSTYSSVATKSFKLTANIDLNGPEEVFYPIGFHGVNNLSDKAAPNSKPFNGEFDGNNYFIDNIVMNLKNQNYVGLFQHLGASAVVKNLNVRGMISIEGSSNYVGSIAGYSEGKIENIISYITLNLDTTYYAGGLVGYQKNNEVIESEYIGFVKVDISGTHVGGILGGAKAVDLNQVLNVSDVQGKDNVGGIIGSAEAITADDLKSSKIVSGSGNYVGGIVGRLFSNSNITNLDACSRVITSGNYSGALVGVIENSNVSNADDDDCSLNLNNSNSEIQASNYAGAVAGACLGNNSFELVTLNRSVISSGFGAALGCAYNEGVEFVDSNLSGRVKASSHYIGGVAGYSAGVIDLEQTVISADIFGTQIEAQNYMGMVAGQSLGHVTISNSDFSGSIGDDPNDAFSFEKCHDYVGGLVGENNKNLIIDNVQLSLSVKCTGSSVGGMIGANVPDNQSYIEISNSQIFTEVEGFYAVGGIVGSNTGKFTLNSSTLDIDVLSETFYAGGVAGFVDVGSEEFNLNLNQVNGFVQAVNSAAGLVAYASSNLPDKIKITDNFIGANGGITIISDDKAGAVAAELYHASISDVHVVDMYVASIAHFENPSVDSKANNIGGIVGVGTYISLIRSSLTGAILHGQNRIAGIASELAYSLVDTVKISNLTIDAIGDIAAGGIGLLNTSILNNLQLGDRDLNKADGVDFISGANFVAGGVAIIEGTEMESVINNSISSFNLAASGIAGGFVASDTSSEITAKHVYFDATRAGTVFSANSIGVDFTSIEMTNITSYGAFDFSSWVKPTYNKFYPDLEL